MLNCEKEMDDILKKAGLEHLSEAFSKEKVYYIYGCMYKCIQILI